MFEGVLFFPVTPFSPAGAVAMPALSAHLERQLAHRPGAVFVACGTGELHALDPDEHARIVRRTVEVVAGRVPVFAGAGGPLPVARRLAGSSQEAGADGVLLLPPYLVGAPQPGLVRYARAVAESTSLQLILYSRANAVFGEAAAVELASVPNVVGLKDGVGDLEALAGVVGAVRESLAGSGKQFTFFNGLPTAEATARAYRAIGVGLYSSAAFCFAPEVSQAFHAALAAGDDVVTESLLTGFFRPLVRLRNTVPGYAVSLIKAGVRMRGLDVGGVRPPLVDPAPEHLDELERIVKHGLSLVGSSL